MHMFNRIRTGGTVLYLTWMNFMLVIFAIVGVGYFGGRWLGAYFKRQDSRDHGSLE